MGSNALKDPFINLNVKFTFGKYKGKKVNYALKREPGYIVWFYENVLDQNLINKEIYEKASVIFKNRKRLMGYSIDNEKDWFEDDLAYEDQF